MLKPFKAVLSAGEQLAPAQNDDIVNVQIP